MTQEPQEPLIPAPLRLLFDAVCDDLATPEQLRELESVLANDQNALGMYLDYCSLHVDLHLAVGEQQSREAIQEKVRAEVAETAETLGFPALALLGNTLQGTAGYSGSGWLVAYLVATVIVGVGLLVSAVTLVSQPVQVAGHSRAMNGRLPTEPKVQFVGRITGMVDCRWSDPTTAVPGPVAVPLGRKYALASGLLEITYDTGAKVILQGPCTYEVESRAGGYLSIGKLTARVDKKEEISHKDCDRDQSQRALTLALSQGERGPGSNSSFLIPTSYFAVRTPTATVTDLGTEFGVEVSEKGVTMSHVFRGSVRLQANSASREAEGGTKVLRENESARVERDGDDLNTDKWLIVSQPSAKAAHFARRLTGRTPTTIDLVDIVAGGNGISRRRGMGINPTNGQIVQNWPTDFDKDFNHIGDGKYHRVEGLPLVDGVFIPDGRTGAVQLDSAGHLFAGFPETANRTYGHIWAGGVVPGPTAQSMELGAIDYASPGHGVLAIHANKGITFDLEAIRQANADRRLTEFHAIAGLPDTSNQEAAPRYVDLWVFVDGQPRFQRREVKRSDSALTVVIPIDDRDRFLTLVATDGRDCNDHDCAVFGDPKLLTIYKTGDGEGEVPEDANKASDGENDVSQ